MSENATANGDEVEEGLLDRVPEWVVPLGAGFLLAATLGSTVFALFGWYSIATGRTYGYPMYALVLLTLQFTFVSVLHAAGTYWARQRVRWMWVMLAAIFGMFLFVTIPLNLGAVICLGLGKRHFAAHTPAKEIMRDIREEDGGEEESEEASAGEP